MKKQASSSSTQEDNTYQVTWEDQKKINTFSRIILRFNELEKEISDLKEETAKLNDASDEIFISDNISYVVGELFVEVNSDQAEKLLEARKEQVKRELKEKQREFKEIETKMKELKANLYAKFGSNINLEERDKRQRKNKVSSIQSGEQVPGSISYGTNDDQTNKNSLHNSNSKNVNASPHDRSKKKRAGAGNSSTRNQSPHPGLVSSIPPQVSHNKVNGEATICMDKSYTKKSSVHEICTQQISSMSNSHCGSFNGDSHFEMKKQLLNETTRRVLSLLKERGIEKREEKYQILCEEAYDHLPKVNSEIELLDGFRKSFELEMEKCALRDLSQTSLQKLKQKLVKEEHRALNSLLPIYSKRHEILKQLEQHDVIICSCSTATGKSTQIPQYLYEAGYSKIVCTQPRKVSTFSLAQRVLEETKNDRQDLYVGYRTSTAFKFKRSHPSSNSSSISSIVYVTDRILLNEYQKDPLLLLYQAILVDEVHERSSYTDILISLLKICVHKRRQFTPQHPLKIILSSATLQTELFSNFFNCPVVHLSYEMYPVLEFYQPQRPKNYEQAILEIVLDIVLTNRHEGDILVFLASPEEIDKCCRKTRQVLNSCAVFPLYGKMNEKDIHAVFEHNEKRKIIYSTNIAETAVTIHGVRIVIDSGVVKERIYDHEKNMSILKISPISQSSATQRKGRAGRCDSGVCYRLYSKSEFYQMKLFTEPEMARSHWGMSILQILSRHNHTQRFPNSSIGMSMEIY
ncbi:hypothetical protein C9374_003128 [Naegleria lovaniensis]|uniref:ATP-dependent RNA helicase n=1 Tax=Naegleria lovaniensis TaxID=51637 RepID=A0AA88GTR6_NAELO|nr:uncharacterized protein C9374_003128 [Naegleria lovaniensis]KAG2385979.1 hypothetical protein C9374_003128 [Naegleria lovaniensis]